MRTVELLTELRRRDVRLWAEGERLRYNAPEGALTPELLTELRGLKGEVLAFLRETDAARRAARPPVRPAARGGVLPLSFAQQRLWFLDQLEPGNPFYNVPAGVLLEGALNVAALAQALGETARRHEVLRTTFAVVGGRAAQVVGPPPPVSIPCVDLAALPGAKSERVAEQLAEAETRRPFDLGRGPLMRPRLLRLGADRHVLMLTAHHIVSDAWSRAILVREVAGLYAAAASGRPSPLAELPVQYADYAAWQQTHLQGEVLGEQLDYWRRRLDGLTPLELPTDKPRPAVRTYRGAVVRRDLHAAASERLGDIARAEGATVYMTLLAGFQILLARYTGQEDIAVGTPVAGRTRPEVEGLIGFFVNNLVMRERVGGGESFRELLGRVRESVLDAHAHQDVPFERLVEELHPERDLSRTPLFQVMFMHINAPEEALAIEGLRIGALRSETGGSKFDLSVSAAEMPGGLALSMEYSTELFAAATAERLLTHFARLLSAAAETPESAVCELPLLGEGERHQLLAEWNDTARAVPGGGALFHEQFACQAALTPDAVAVVCGEEQLTYAALDRRANTMAWRLRAAGVGPEVLVAVFAERGLDFLSSVLAVFKAGGAYLPLETSSPAHRLAQVVEQSRCEFIICGRGASGAAALKNGGRGPRLLTSEELCAAGGRADDPRVRVRPNGCAYVIYTSGSTGTPKGAVIEHAGMLNHIHAKIHDTRLTASDVLAQTASQCFDSSVWQFLAPLVVGGRVCIVEEDAAHAPDLLLGLVETAGVTVLSTVPSMLRAMLETVRADGPRRRKLAGLRCLLEMGEALPADLCARWMRLYPATEVINAYGLTECSDDVTHYVVREAPGPEQTRVPIGGPLANTRFYLLDREAHAAPLGVVGELHVGGVAVGRGYLHDPALTATKFVPDPFSREPGARLYRAGDLARHLPDGGLDYLGRADHQVKIRGFRIEFGEIEAALAEHPSVAECVVVARADAAGQPQLVAYVVAREGRPATAAELKGFARARLPDYMVPSAVVALDSLPLNANGKLDRRALPAPGPADAAAEFVAPRTPVEEILASFWAHLLGRERVGADDNFFDLGGHSLLITQVISRVRESLQAELLMRDVFEAPTVAGLAARVEQRRRAGRAAAPPVGLAPRHEPLPLSFGQERFWFFDQLTPGSAAYNIPGAVRLEGPLSVAALGQSLGEVSRRHESLRTTFVASDGRPVQVVSGAAAGRLPVVDLSRLADAARDAAARRLAAEEAARPFDLARGPLLRASLLRLAAGEHVLLTTVHHIVADGWSVGLLVRELAALYAAFSGGGPSPLAELEVQYADFALWQRGWLQGQVLEEQVAYWKERLRGAPALELPTDRPRPAVRSFRGASLRSSLAEGPTRALNALARAEGATVYMTLLAGFQILLARYTGQEDITVGTPVAGRTRPEVEPLIGPFINNLVMRERVEGGESFRELLGRVRESVLDAHAHQDVPFEKLVEELQPERDLSRTPLFQVMLILQNAPGGEAAVEGLRMCTVRSETGGSKFDLTVSAAETGGALALGAEYSTELFAAATAERLLTHFARLLSAAAETPESPVCELPLLGEGERHQLLAEWNDTGDDRAALAEPVHGQFARQAAARPDAVAVVCGDEQLTYAELDNRAEAVARRLRSLGVGPDSLVGVCLGRSAALVAALLGVLKAGGAYVPLDPSYPAERLAFMLEDSGARVLLTERGAGPRFEGFGGAVLRLDAERGALGAVGGAATVATSPSAPSAGAVGVTPGNLAYCIYTSGSTGRPKGVMVSHGCVANFLAGMDERVGCGPGDTLLAVTSISFDISVLELFWTLARGARLLLLTEREVLGGPASGERPVARSMDFSLFYFANDESGGAGQEKYRLLLDGARFADRHGFRAVWTPERHFHQFGGLYPNPSVVSSALAMVTERVRLRAGSVVMPLHSPLRVAEEWALVDNLSNGRVDIAFASGWHADDFALMPGNYAERKAAMAKGIEDVRRLWRGEALRVFNGAGNEVEVKVYPQPVQPELPVWITAAGDPQTFIQAGRLGANVLTHLLGQSPEEVGEKIRLYRAARAEHGHDPEAGQVALMLHTFLGTDREAVREAVRGPFTQYLRSSVGLLANLAKGLNLSVGRDGLSEQDTEALLEFAFDRYFETSALFGTPDSCALMVGELKGLGVNEVACLIDFGVETETVLASLELLAELKELSNRGAEAVEHTLASQARAHGATHLQCTPSTMKLLGVSAESVEALKSLRVLMLGGEALPPQLAAEVLGQFPCRLLNMYGPTETTIWSAAHELRGATEGGVPVGRPVTNTQLRVLDRRLGLAPAGVAGELHIGGAGVARGYLNRPELTAERFTPDPFSTEPGARLYRTGDVARWGGGGRLDYLGRMDQQVKVRGHRIELGEVEAALAAHAGVGQAVVVVREDEPGDACLVAYVVPAPGAESPAAGELRRHLQAWLPEYMVPSAVVALDSLPLTPNGKLDRRALPAPGGRTAEREAAFVAPQTPTEKELAVIWGEVLRLEGVGASDNFFDLGGHSLQAVRVVARVEAKFGIRLPLREFFMAPTIAGLAPRVEEAVVAQADPEKMDELLALLETMGEDEALRMLSADGAAGHAAPDLATRSA